ARGVHRGGDELAGEPLGRDAVREGDRVVERPARRADPRARVDEHVLGVDPRDAVGRAGGGEDIVEGRLPELEPPDPLGVERRPVAGGIDVETTAREPRDEPEDEQGEDGGRRASYWRRPRRPRRSARPPPGSSRGTRGGS